MIELKPARPPVTVERWHAMLLGSVFAMAGMAGYVASMASVGTGGSLLEGFANHSLLGAGSAAALAIGVVLWCAGNFRALQELAGIPGEE